MTNSTRSPTSASKVIEDIEYDDWFRQEVRKTLDGIKDGSIDLLSEEEHDRRWQQKRAALKAAAGKHE